MVIAHFLFGLVVEIQPVDLAIVVSAVPLPLKLDHAAEAFEMPLAVLPLLVLAWRDLRCSLNWLMIAFLLAICLEPQAYDQDKMMAAAAALGSRAKVNAGALQQLIAQGSRATDDSRIRATNQFFNDAIQYADDSEVWGVKDYWASPLEMLSKGVGDCEDFAIGKYFALLAMGVPQSKLRMVFVRAMMDGPAGPGQPHMVLAFYPAAGSEPLILDSLAPEVAVASQRRDLLPIFSFNSEGMWEGTNGRANGDPLSRFSKWRDVTAKARAEGF